MNYRFKWLYKRLCDCASH